MVFIAILAVGWVIATGTVYSLMVRGRWPTKLLLLAIAALAGAATGYATTGVTGAAGWPGMPFAAGAIVFTITAEALLLVWGVQRFGKS